MVYNKTKRGLEMASGIVGVVVSSILSLVFLYYLIVTIIFIGYYPWIAGYLIAEIIVYTLLSAFSVLSLIFYASVIKSPVQADGTIKQRKGRRICVVVFSVLTLQWVTAGLMIAVLCLKDSQLANPAQSQSAQAQIHMQTQAPQTLDAKVAELKHLKELGVLDEESYKKAINKLIQNIL